VLQTLADTLVVLTQCYASAMGITPMWDLQIVVKDTTPKIYAASFADAPVLMTAKPQGEITYNSRTLKDASDLVRRRVVIHELLHIYWAPVKQAARWAAFHFGEENNDPKMGPNMNQLIENLTEHQANLAFWQRLCGHP
jgi:hypothetical protein